MSNMVRFTAYLSAEEKRHILAMANQYGTSENFVLRMAVRKLFDLSVPAHLTPEPADRAGRV